MKHPNWKRRELLIHLMNSLLFPFYSFNELESLTENANYFFYSKFDDADSKKVLTNFKKKNKPAIPKKSLNICYITKSGEMIIISTKSVRNRKK